MEKNHPGLYFRSLLLLTAVQYLICASSPLIAMPFQQDSVPRPLNREQPVYTTSRLTAAKPVIDGKLDDECWRSGTWAGNYTQFIPREGARPTWPTELNIQYDDKNLYIAFRAYDGEPEKILRRAGVRDEIVGDMVGITFDSYRDYRTGFEFTITAWGQKVDLVLFNPMDWDFNWNAVWKGKTGLEDSAWVAELEVPFSQLRYSNKEEQVWGMHTWRWIERLQEESNWEKQSKTGPGMLYNFGELRGISGLRKSRRLELLPYSLAKLEASEPEPGNPFLSDGKQWGGNIGLDSKVGISSNFTIDLTINPDFGQVESDPSVMNLTAFETFYEEKRPFFLEGLTIFDYKFDDQSLFYSRRIGHSPSYTVQPDDGDYAKSPEMTTILGALKFSGTTSKGLSIGLIQSLTAPEYAEIADMDGNRSEMMVEPFTNYTVARIQKGYNEGTTVVGGIFTSANRLIEEKNLDFLAANAFTGGFDMLHWWNDKEYYIESRLTGSMVTGSQEAITRLQESSARYYQRPGATYLDYDTTRRNLGGFGGKLKIGKGAKGLWKYSTGFSFLSPGLELNDLGYMKTADEISQENEITYFINQPVSLFNTFNITLEQFNRWNFNSTFLGSGGHLSFTSQFKNRWNLGLNLIFHSAAWDTRILRGGYDMRMPYSSTFFGNLGSDPSKKITAGIRYRYEWAGNNSGELWQADPEFTIRPLSLLKISITANYQKNMTQLQYVGTVDYMDETGYLLGTINQKTIGVTFRADINITPQFSVQYYGSPFVSRGIFTEFRRVISPGARDYSERFSVLPDPVSSDGNYYFDENNDMLPDYHIPIPDFNFLQFRSNLVAKWEYRLGSFIYFVWSSERTGEAEPPDVSIQQSFSQLGKIFPRNIFLLKLNYWFSL